MINIKGGIIKVNKYNTRVREIVSDMYVGYSKDKQETLKTLRKVQTKLDNEDGKLTYNDYIKLSKQKTNLQDKIKELEIRIDCMDLVREICLNVCEELNTKT